MKKLFALLALVLGVVSCQTEPEGFDVVVGGEQEVMLNVSLPEATRANSAEGFNLANIGDYSIRYILEVAYNGKVLRDAQISKNSSATFPVRLAPGRDYQFTVWADLVTATSVDKAEWYNTDLYYNTAAGLDEIEVKVDKWTANTEARDAWTCTKSVKFGKNPDDLSLTLTRPFAKVRVVTTDLEQLNSFNIKPNKGVVTYSAGIYTSFNAVENTVGNKTTTTTNIEYTINPDAYSYLTNDDKETDSNRLTVFADYILVPVGGDNVQFTLDVYDTNLQGSDARIKSTNFNTQIPVERNKVTSIVGDVLTDGGNVSITINGELGKGETITLVDTAESLQEVIAGIEVGGSANIELGGDIDLGDLFGASTLSTRAAATLPIVIAEGRTLVLDLNGFNITTPFVEGSTTNHCYAFENNGSLTIQDSKGNGQIIARGIFNYGTMTLKSGIINACDGNGGYGVRNYEGAEFVMNGGSIVTSYEDGDTPGNGYDASPVRVDEGATATFNGGTINNISNFTVAIDNYGETTINGGTFTTIHTTIANSATMTINGGSFTCNGLEGVTAHAFWAAAGTATINGGTFDGKDNYNGFNVCASKGATVNIKGGEFLSVHSGSLYGEGTIIVTGGEFFDNPSKFVNDDYTVVKDDNGLWTIKRKDDVAKIGEVGYTSLAKAVAAIQDGETITLVADEVFTENNYYDNGGWKDGLGYSGDKSFTIDLNSKTIRQNGALNDYLIWIKNDGSKANTITLKNGTLDAGTTAYCAFATASSNKQKITINLEDINLVGNNSNGAVAKIRGGAELNVKSGTVITGKNNYVGIEAVGNNTVVNIYDNVNIYQNGTSSYVGAIVGASYNATMNIYGGYGKSAKCGIIVMSTGATINVSGGEWIANNDGTVATENNAVLVSQNNRYETGWACKSILNVTGGTFKGGYNCYGMGPGVEPDDAQINIKGGNFNADPASYVVAGYEAKEENGVYTVGKPKALADFEAAIAQGGSVTLSADITLLESVVIEGKNVVLDLNGKTVTAPLFSAFEVKNGAELTIKNGKVVAYESTVRAIGGKAVIESGEYTSTGTALDSPATYRYSLDCRENGELVVNGGTFKSNNGMINVGSTVTINGGKFENVIEKTMTRHFAYVSAPLTINDGEFYGKANSSAGGCFFCGAAAGGNIQINGGKFTSLWTSGSVNRIFEVYFGGTINVTGGMFNTNGGIASFVTENTDEVTKAAYPYVAK